jgi:mannose-6-phosphate isomerase-like protein (cupin superfamily)
MSYQYTPWQWGDVTESELRAEMRSQGLAPFTWRNGPGDHFSYHSRSYTRIIYIISGSATFHFAETNEAVNLEPGDKIEIEARTQHAIDVGPEGVYGLEAALRRR